MKGEWYRGDGRSKEFSLPITRICYILTNSKLQTRGGEPGALGLLSDTQGSSWRDLPNLVNGSVLVPVSSYFFSPFLRSIFLILSSFISTYDTSHLLNVPLNTSSIVENLQAMITETISRSFRKGVAWILRGWVVKMKEYKILELWQIIKQMC